MPIIEENVSSRGAEHFSRPLREPQEVPWFIPPCLVLDSFVSGFPTEAVPETFGHYETFFPVLLSHRRHSRCSTGTFFGDLGSPRRPHCIIAQCP